MYSPSHSSGGGGQRGYGSPQQHHGHAHSHAHSHSHSHSHHSERSSMVSLPPSGAAGNGKYVPRTPEVGRMNVGARPSLVAPSTSTPTKKVAHVDSNTVPQSAQSAGQSWTGLDLSRMKLRAVSPSIAIYSFLTELYLQFNNLSVLPVEMFSALTNLRVLDLSYNAIVYLPAEISHLLHLNTLLLINNSVRELPVEMGKLFRMEKMAVEGNPLQDPPQDIVDKGAQAIVSYLRDRMPAGAPPPPRNWLVNPHVTDDDLGEAVTGSRLPVRRKLQLEEEAHSGSPPVKPVPKSISLDPENPNHLKSPQEIRVICYNILAENYAMSERINYCPQWALQWDYRKHRILKEITLYDPDIMCLQEVESEQYRSFFMPEMAQRGYAGVFRPKSRARTMEDWRRVDGCVIFYRRDMFEEVQEYIFEFQSIALQKHEQLTIGGSDSGMNRLITKDNIAVALVLQWNTAPSRRNTSSSKRDRLVIVNTHIHWDPEYADVKLMQTQMLIEKLEEVLISQHNRVMQERSAEQRSGGSNSNNSRGRGTYNVSNSNANNPNAHAAAVNAAMQEIPVILTGDFNSVPGSGVYKLLSEKGVEGTHEDFLSHNYGKYSQQGLRHNVGLKSSYSEVAGEPSFTNYTGDFVGVLDYVWYSPQTMRVERILDTVDESIVLSQNGALPNPYMCSDHLPLVVDFSLLS